jgi:hypothetical protein
MPFFVKNCPEDVLVLPDKEEQITEELEMNHEGRCRSGIQF